MRNNGTGNNGNTGIRDGWDCVAANDAVAQLNDAFTSRRSAPPVHVPTPEFVFVHPVINVQEKSYFCIAKYGKTTIQMHLVYELLEIFTPENSQFVTH